MKLLKIPMNLKLRKWVDVAEDVDPAEADVDHERVVQVSSIKHLQLF
jgi:hypothetical protein